MFLMNTQVVNIPTSYFWETINTQLMLGFGMSQEHILHVERYMGRIPADYFDGSASSKEGIDYRLMLLAFALTIPKDMIP